MYCNGYGPHRILNDLIPRRKINVLRMWVPESATLRHSSHFNGISIDFHALWTRSTCSRLVITSMSLFIHWLLDDFACDTLKMHSSTVSCFSLVSLVSIHVVILFNVFAFYRLFQSVHCQLFNSRLAADQCLQQVTALFDVLSIIMDH